MTITQALLDTHKREQNKFHKFTERKYGLIKNTPLYYKIADYEWGKGIETEMYLLTRDYNDIAPANAASFDTIWISDGKKIDDNQAHYTFQNLMDFNNNFLTEIKVVK